MRHPGCFLVLLAQLALAGCAASASSSRQPVEPISVLIDRQVAERQGLAWSTGRRLQVTDFRGTPPQDPGQEAARIAYGIFDGARCTGPRFEYHVVAAMLPDQSWIAPAIRASSTETARALAHEQTHFDLTEVHARRIRRHLAELTNPCMRTQDELQTSIERFLREEAAEQTRYDEETRNGRDSTRQESWDRDVARRLLERRVGNPRS
jgi:hypothetical protein